MYDFKLVGFSEIDKYSICSYCAIHNVDKELNIGNVITIDPLKLSNFNLMTWGFPCQDISVAGKQRGIVEGVTRSGLYYEGLKILKIKRPKYSIIENVSNLVSNKFKDTFEQILKDLEELGYTNYWRVLNLKNYGIPHNRERVFIVSILGEHEPFVFDNGFNSENKFKDLVESEVADKYYLSEYTQDKLCIDKIKYTGFANMKGYQKNSDTMNCICASVWKGMGNQGINVVVERDNNRTRIRKLTPKECWRALGFTDDDYQLAKSALNTEFYNNRDISDTQLYKQAGNSIGIPILEMIIRNLFKDGDKIELLELFSGIGAFHKAIRNVNNSESSYSRLKPVQRRPIFNIINRTVPLQIIKK